MVITSCIVVTNNLIKRGPSGSLFVPFYYMEICMQFNTGEEVFSWLETEDPTSITSLSDGTWMVTFVIHSDEQILDLILNENVGLEIIQNEVTQYIMRNFSNNTWSLESTI